MWNFFDGIFCDLFIGLWIPMKDEVEPQHGIGLRKRETERKMRLESEKEDKLKRKKNQINFKWTF